MLIKKCSRCKKNKPYSDYHKAQNKYGIKAECRECSAKRFAVWRADNLESARYNDKISQLVKRFNFTKEYAKYIVDNPNGICTICGNHKKLVVDHCHKSNEVRGRICSFCNSVLGYSQDNIHTLENAIKYLKDFYGTE